MNRSALNPTFSLLCAAALIVGAIWMVWHLPAFIFMPDLPQSGMSLPIFVFGRLALSVSITWLFLNARHSILIAAIIPHTIANAWGEAIGPMTWINAGVSVGGALLLVWLVGQQEVPDERDIDQSAKETLI